MCEYISWKEVKAADGSTQILFLTYDDIYNTSRGLELRNYTTADDLCGHGAIDYYYQLNGKGKNKECADFSSPKNFPPEIVTALKAGLMRGIVDYFPSKLLRAPLAADFEAKRDALAADFEAKRAPLAADYRAKRDTLAAAYEAKRDALYADYEKKRDALYADYEKKRDALYADYKKKRNALIDEQWDLFLDPENRAEAWR